MIQVFIKKATSDPWIMVKDSVVRDAFEQIKHYCMSYEKVDITESQGAYTPHTLLIDKVSGSISIHYKDNQPCYE